VRLRIGLLPVIAAVTGVLASHVAPDARTPSVRIIFPADQVVLSNGRFELIGLLPPEVRERPTLHVDGKLVHWEPTAPPTLLARCDLQPGRHLIRVGELKLRIYVSGKGSLPAELSQWTALRAHPGSADGWNDCAACHAVSEANGQHVIGAVQTPSACARCHSEEVFQLAHFHPEKPLAGCQECHALHGSERKALLKASAKELCGRCHD